MGPKIDYRQEAIVLCCEAINNSAKQLGLAQYNLAHERYEDLIAQLELINELKAKLYSLERRLEQIYDYLNNDDAILEDEYYERANNALILG